MTQEEIYVLGRRTWLDKVLFYSFLPALPVFIMIGVTILINDSEVSSATVKWGIVFAMLVPIVAACRTWYAARTKRFRDEYYIKTRVV